MFCGRERGGGALVRDRVGEDELSGRVFEGIGWIYALSILDEISWSVSLAM